MTRKRTRKPAKRAPKKTGRPPIYMADDHCRMAREYSANGKTLIELAEAIGVHVATLHSWKDEHPAFGDAIRLGREDLLDNARVSLYRRAIGYSHQAEKIVTLSAGQFGGSYIERVKIVEHYPPDVAALRFLLTNRDPANWKDRQEVKHEGTLTLEQVLAQSSLPPASEPPAPATPTTEPS